MLLRPLLLRPQDQEIHDDEDQHEGQQVRQQIAAAEGARLGKRGRHEHLAVLYAGIPVPSRLRRVPGNEIGADYSGQPPNCNVALPLESGWIQPFPGPFAVPGEGCGIAAFGPSANALAVAPAFHRPAARGVARTPGNRNSTPAETAIRE